jgi:hypothetical protein
MTVLITGGTGFIGRNLVESLTGDGNHCVVLVRPNSRRLVTPGVDYRSYEDLPERADVVVNLAGEWVVGRWTAAKKARIMASRVETTRRIVDWMAQCAQPPQAFLSASAVGYYGDRPGEVLTEDSPPDPNDRFRAQVCRAWEEEAWRARDLGIRTVTLRTGNVLSPRGGFLGMLMPVLRRAPFLMPFAPDAVNPWIGLPDAVNLIRFALNDPNVEGPLNVTAPEPVTMRHLVDELARCLGKRSFGTLPQTLMQLALGEFSQSMLESLDVRPAKALASGYTFAHPKIETCLDALMN